MNSKFTWTCGSCQFLKNVAKSENGEEIGTCYAHPPVKSITAVEWKRPKTSVDDQCCMFYIENSKCEE